MPVLAMLFRCRIEPYEIRKRSDETLQPDYPGFFIAVFNGTARLQYFVRVHRRIVDEISRVSGVNLRKAFDVGWRSERRRRLFFHSMPQRFQRQEFLDRNRDAGIFQREKEFHQHGGSVLELVLQVAFDSRPFRFNDREDDGVAIRPIGHDHMVAQHAVQFCAEPLDGCNVNPALTASFRSSVAT